MDEFTSTRITPQTTQTNLATVILVAAVSLIPTSSYAIPSWTHLSHARYAKFEGPNVSFPSQEDKMQKYVKILETFASSILDGSSYDDLEIAIVTNKRFVDMYDDF